MTGMDENGKKPAKTGKTGSREARLAAALRENLRRRKAQERGRGTRLEPEHGQSPLESPQGDENH